MYVRAGTYTILGELTIPAGVRLAGVGIGQTIIIGPSSAGVSMRMIAMTAGTATAATHLSNMSLVSPAPVAGVIYPVNSNYGLVQVASWCVFADLDLTITGSGSISHAQCVGFASHSGYGQVWGVTFTDCVVRSVSMTLNTVEVMGWWMDSVGNAPVPAVADVVLTRCTFYASGSEQTLFVTNSAHGFWFALDGVRLVDCAVFKSHGFAWEGYPTGAIRSPVIQGLTVDARGTTIARPYHACLIIPTAAVGGNSLDDINISGLRLYGDANVTNGSTVYWLGTGGAGAAAVDIRGTYVECASACTVAGAGGLSFNGEANNVSGAIVIARLGTTGDIDLVSVAATGSTRNVSFQVVCRNIDIGNDTKYSQLRFVSPQVSGTLTVGENAADVQTIGGSVATLVNNSISTTIVDTNLGGVGIINVKPTVTTTPAAPLAGQLTTYTDKYAERLMLFALGPDAVARPVQSFLGSARTMIWNPPGGLTATVPGIFGAPPANTSNSSVLTARAVATTNYFTRVRRVGWVGVAAAGRLAGWKWAASELTIGDGAGTGGFFLVGTFGCSDAVAIANARQFYGLTQGTGDPTAALEPSTLGNTIGVGHGAADTTLKLFYGGSAAQTPIDLGANFPVSTQSVDWYELVLWAPAYSVDVHYRVTRKNTGHMASGTLSGTAGVVLPDVTTLMGFQTWRSNNASTNAAAMDYGQLYVETES